jgi:hypothetical protein
VLNFVFIVKGQGGRGRLEDVDVFFDTLTNVSVTNCTASSGGLMKWLLSDKLA